MSLPRIEVFSFDGMARFLIYWSVDEYGRAEAKVYYAVTEASGVFPATDCYWPCEIHEADLYLEVQTDSEGCSHVRPSEYWHLCGPWGHKVHIALIEHLYRRSMEILGSDDEWVEN